MEDVIGAGNRFPASAEIPYLYEKKMFCVCCSDEQRINNSEKLNSHETPIIDMLRLYEYTAGGSYGRCKQGDSYAQQDDVRAKGDRNTGRRGIW